jgi:hypothetical protein
MTNSEQNQSLSLFDHEMQRVIEEMNKKMEILQREVDRQALVVARMKANREAWLNEHDKATHQTTARNIADYKREIYCPKGEIDYDPQKGRILRATSDIEEAEVILVEDAVVYTYDREHEIYRPNLGFLFNTWCIVKAMATLNGDQLALIEDMANSKQEQIDFFAEKLAELRQQGISALPHSTPKIEANLIGICQTNAFQCKLEDGSKARGIFPLAAILSHSCHPNSCHKIIDGRLFMQAMIPIAAGQEITHSYIEDFTPQSRRQQIFWEQFGFICRCEACNKR